MTTAKYARALISNFCPLRICDSYEATVGAVEPAQCQTRFFWILRCSARSTLVSTNIVRSPATVTACRCCTSRAFRVGVTHEFGDARALRVARPILDAQDDGVGVVDVRLAHVLDAASRVGAHSLRLVLQ